METALNLPQLGVAPVSESPSCLCTLSHCNNLLICWLSTDIFTACMQVHGYTNTPNPKGSLSSDEEMYDSLLRTLYSELLQMGWLRLSVWVLV